MSEITKPYKGTRDFYPADKRAQKWMFSVVRRVAESFGYEEYDAPILEETAIYNLKGNAEIIAEESYSFTDRGGRSVTIRPEMTPSVSRMVAAKRQELPFPLRWYSIPNCWRYERPQRGRRREFWQPNFDLFGAAGVEADFEILQMADAIMRAFGAKRSMYTFKINSRKFMNKVLYDYVGLNEVEAVTVQRLIDKRAKMEAAEFIAAVEAAMTPPKREYGAVSRLMTVLNAKSAADFPEELRNDSSLDGIKKLVALIETAGISNAEFDPSLMRGFDYYTDFVFEVFDNHPDNNRSMFGGGRYDGLVGLFGVAPIETVGFAMGDATLENFLTEHKLWPELPNETELAMVLIGDVYQSALPLIESLREEKVRLSVDFGGRKLGKSIEMASKKGIRYLIVVGGDELKDQSFKLKDLTTGKEETHSLERIVSIIKSGASNTDDESVSDLI